MAKGMGTYLMSYGRCPDHLDQVGRVPPGVLPKVRAAIMQVTVTVPVRVVRRPRHVRMGQSTAASLTAFEEQVSHSGPCNRNGSPFQYPQDNRNVDARPNSHELLLLKSQASKRPLQFKICRNCYRSLRSTQKWGDLDPVKLLFRWTQPCRKVTFEPENRFQQ